MITPHIRAFLDDLHETLAEHHEFMLTTDGDTSALVRIEGSSIEIEVSDRTVRLRYGGEWQLLHDHAFALQVVQALFDGRVEIEIHHGLLWRTTRSYLDGSARPFVTTRMPVPSLRIRTERRRVVT